MNHDHRYTRRSVLRTLGLGFVGMSVAGKVVARRRVPEGLHEFALYIGTYTGGKSEGIYRARFDASSGGLKVEGVVKGVENPSYVAVDHPRSRLFCVNETSGSGNESGGSVSSFSIDPGSGDLHFINKQQTRGADPCHVIIGGHGRFLLVANYSGGSVTVLPVGSDGRIGEASDVIQHHGSGPHPRQQGPHAHSVALDAAGKFAYVADLGLDKVMIYRFDDRKGKLLSSNPPWADLKPGSGPRHMTFSPDGDTLYVVNELSSTLTVFTADHGTGALRERQTLSTLPPDFKSENLAADVHVSLSGGMIYASNRGHNSIAVFVVDKKTNQLSSVQHQSTMGKWPRNFSPDPTGSYLLVANQKSDSVAVFVVNKSDGRLSPHGDPVLVPEPVCVRFFV